MSLEEKESSWIAAKKDLEHQLRLQTEQTKACRQTEALLQREIASLQELNASFDHLPDKSVTALASASVQSKLDALQLDLHTTQEELLAIRIDRDRIQVALEESLSSQRNVNLQIDQVKEKYGKLREALELQKQASVQAEQRALRAEELAGRGSFNPSTTRVVHLTQNPLTTTLKEQNASLKQRLEEYALAASSSTSTATTTPGASKGMFHKRLTPQSAAPPTVSSSTLTATTAEVNPDKLHQRLKQQFQHQIALFREGVHLITGYKIDMLPDHDRPTFRVRTMYAERERDELIFQWPKGKEGQSVTSLDLLYSDWAKLLMKSASYDYVTKYHSVPAFVAAVQLEQFESTTKIMM
jgi:Mitotic checkpoint protein